MKNRDEIAQQRIWRAYQQDKMSIPEVIATVCCTVAGSVAIAYTTFHLQGKHRKRTLFRALYSEIKLNHSVAQQRVAGLSLTTGYAPLYAEAYYNIRVTGELLTVPELVRRELEEAYELISAYNRQIPAVEGITLMEDQGLYKMIEKIMEKLKILKDELPKNAKYLRQ